MRRRALPRSLALALAPGLLACDGPAPEPTPTVTPEPTPAATPPAPSGEHFFTGALIIPTNPPQTLEWMISYDLSEGQTPAAKLWIPAQNAEALPTSSVELGDDNAVIMSWDEIMVRWSISADGHSCGFTQAGATVECELDEIEAEEFAQLTARDRPQHPEPPFPYASEELKIKNPAAEGVTLAATLTVPEGEGPHPAVVLVSGSGAQDRDETIFGHKPFWVIADHLTRQGVAVIRYDDRGWAESSGDPNGTTEDFASDALAVLRAVAARPDIDAKRVGIIGHSEGGVIAPLLAAKHPKEVAFIVMLAGTGVVGHELLSVQTEAAMRFKESDEAKIEADMKVYSKIYELIATREAEDAKTEIEALWTAAKADEPGLEALLAVAGNEWMRFFLAHDPQTSLRKVKCPVLALIGTTDIQVDDEQNLPPIKAALKKARNKDATVLARPGLNHMFQHSESGNPEDYGTITETFDPETLELIAKWIVEHTEARS